MDESEDGGSSRLILFPKIWKREVMSKLNVWMLFSRVVRLVETVEWVDAGAGSGHSKSSRWYL